VRKRRQEKAGGRKGWGEEETGGNRGGEASCWKRGKRQKGDGGIRGGKNRKEEDRICCEGKANGG